MRITIIVPGLDVSGGSRIVAGHARRLVAKGHEVLFVAPRAPTSLSDRTKQFLGIGPPAFGLRQSHVGLAEVPLHIPRHRGPIRSKDVPDADVIIATWWETAEWIWPMPVCKGAKVHFIQHYEAFPYVPKQRVDAVWLLPTTKIAVAQWLVDLGREQFGIDHMTVVPNSVDPRFFHARERIKREPPTVGFLYHRADYKDFPTTLAAIERLKQMRSDVRFKAFGSMLPMRSELPSAVDFNYLPTEEQIASVYTQCDVWLSTSRSEGFNLPPLEAMASGCPAVCAKTGRPLEIIDNGVNGYLVNQGDVEGFARALANILSLPDRSWTDMSEAARQSVLHPTWEESNARFEDALIKSIAVR